MPASPLLMEINEVTQLLQDRRGKLRCINEGPGGGRGTSHQEAALLCPFSHLRQPSPVQHAQTPGAVAGRGAAGWGAVAEDRGPGNTLWSETLRP